MNINRLISFKDACIKECCLRHGIPSACLKEKLHSQVGTIYNSTHMKIFMAMSKNCYTFHDILKNCELECFEGKKGKYKIDRYLSYFMI